MVRRRDVGRDTHSWIEHLGEAFDSAMVLADGKPEQVLWVRQASELRAFYQAVAVEARTFKDFVDWMARRAGSCSSATRWWPASPQTCGARQLTVAASSSEESDYADR